MAAIVRMTTNGKAVTIKKNFAVKNVEAVVMPMTNWVPVHNGTAMNVSTTVDIAVVGAVVAIVMCAVDNNAVPVEDNRVPHKLVTTINDPMSQEPDMNMTFSASPKIVARTHTVAVTTSSWCRTVAGSCPLPETISMVCAAGRPLAPGTPFSHYFTRLVDAGFYFLIVTVALVSNVDDPMRGLATGAISGPSSVSCGAALGLATGSPVSPSTPRSNNSIFSVRNGDTYCWIANIMNMVTTNVEDLGAREESGVGDTEQRDHKKGNRHALHVRR